MEKSGNKVTIREWPLTPPRPFPKKGDHFMKQAIHIRYTQWVNSVNNKKGMMPPTAPFPKGGIQR